MIIVLVGCYEGLKVTGSAESVGQQTTRSVVEAIFMILVLDAFFAVFFTAIGI
jgi:phospholipid/cholesterol/gamma-HCH transport system permease protein